MMRALSALSCACILAGCSAIKVIPGQAFPRPLIERLPVSGNLILKDAFRNHSTTKSTNSRVRFEMGAAQSSIFVGVFEALLAMPLSINSDQPHSLHIEPSLLDLQHVAPSQGGQGAYEVWLKYRVQVFHGGDGQGQLADWQLSCYGRAPASTFGNGWNQATTNALRDIGAQLGIGFARQPDIVRWLEEQGR